MMRRSHAALAFAVAFGLAAAGTPAAVENTWDYSV